MESALLQEEITNLCNSLDEIHIYDPALISMTDEEYNQFLKAQFEGWEEYDLISEINS